MTKLLNYRKIFQYLFIPGLILTVAGLVAGFTTKTWGAFYIGLVVIGGICLVIWLLFILITGQSFWQKRSTQAGTNALISTLSLFIILGLINFIAIRYFPRIDLTDNQLYTLSAETQSIVENLQQPIKVLIFDKETNPQDKDLLENYKRYNNKFEFEIVDPDVKVGLTKEFNVKSLGDVYLKYGNKKQLVQTLIAFNNREALSEIKLTNAIEKIKKDYIPTIYLLQGHGEYSLEKENAEQGSLSEAVSSLENKGYNVKPLNLVESFGIPTDADAIIIASPKRKLFDQEVQALKTYSEEGGNLLLLLDPNTDPGLEPLFKDWGIKLDNRIIIDGSGAGDVVGLGPTTPFITTYGNHPITKEFANGISFYPLSRPIDTVEVKGVEATSLIVTSDKMWAENDLESGEVTFDPKTDISGPFDLGVALTRKINPTEKNNDANGNKVEEKKENTNSSPSPSPSSNNEKPKKTESRLIIIGNSIFATNNLFGQQLNGDVFLNSVQWLGSQDEQPLSIRPKEAKNRRINLSSLQVNLLALLALVIFPLSALVAAVVTWWRRR
ncbi:Gldg family protein [Crocosphaera sp. UHCC 0190]|uniref:GldG family protein n=1 Tax=Crocosphaera sp. UHCC 0190 TaxID=3110246 RepID=UPI002B21BA14|nr:Gldg family protein [Crocosphaera sp. UHCC 0190]MEA5509647.1 Gldg family protein [Crocosphaera sp. UHCC 0190]